jgi:hypothetical protein
MCAIVMGLAPAVAVRVNARVLLPGVPRTFATRLVVTGGTSFAPSSVRLMGAFAGCVGPDGTVDVAAGVVAVAAGVVAVATGVVGVAVAVAVVGVAVAVVVAVPVEVAVAVPVVVAVAVAGVVAVVVTVVVAVDGTTVVFVAVTGAWAIALSCEPKRPAPTSISAAIVATPAMAIRFGRIFIVGFSP